jgi:hypothetical protein
VSAKATTVSPTSLATDIGEPHRRLRRSFATCLRCAFASTGARTTFTSPAAALCHGVQFPSSAWFRSAPAYRSARTTSTVPNEVARYNGVHPAVYPAVPPRFRSALASTNARTVSTLPHSAAMCNGVHMCARVCSLGAALRPPSPAPTPHTSTSPLTAVVHDGVHPRVQAWLTSAPASTSASTASSLPLRAKPGRDERA